MVPGPHRGPVNRGLQGEAANRHFNKQLGEQTAGKWGNALREALPPKGTAPCYGQGLGIEVLLNSRTELFINFLSIQEFSLISGTDCSNCGFVWIYRSA